VSAESATVVTSIDAAEQPTKQQAVPAVDPAVGTTINRTKQPAQCQADVPVGTAFLSAFIAALASGTNNLEKFNNSAADNSLTTTLLHSTKLHSTPP
jgi:hypothetical protein